MRRFGFVTLDVFTRTRFGGNPLAVFPEAQGLSDAEMQALATEFNLSETAFVLPPADPAHTARVRIFNPVAEMPFAGHPNVGTAFALAGAGRDVDGRMVFEEIAGLVEVRIERDAAGQVALAEIDAPAPLTTGGTVDVTLVAACATLSAGDIVTDGHPPTIAGVGLPFLFAEVAADVLDRASPDTAAFHRLAAIFPEAHLHLYARDSDGLSTRMFAPTVGIAEDPATGSANAALGAFLLSLDGGDTLDLAIRQGVAMGRSSELNVRARRTPDGIRAKVGGASVAMMRGEVEL